LSPVGSETKESYKTFADCCKDNVSDRDLENEKGKHKLHYYADDHEPPINGAFVGREEERNSGYNDETDQPADDREDFHAAILIEKSVMRTCSESTIRHKSIKF